MHTSVRWYCKVLELATEQRAQSCHWLVRASVSVVVAITICSHDCGVISVPYLSLRRSTSMNNPLYGAHTPVDAIDTQLFAAATENRSER